MKTCSCVAYNGNFSLYINVFLTTNTFSSQTGYSNMEYFAKIELICPVFDKLASNFGKNWPVKTFEEPVNYSSDKNDHILKQLYQHLPVKKSTLSLLNCHILSFEL